MNVTAEGSDGERQDSTPMEILRLREESHAWAQWQEVMAQCAAVSDTHTHAHTSLAILYRD